MRYSFVWLLFAMMRILVRLPLRWQLALGRTVGRLAEPLATNRRKVALRNLQLCFPEMSAEEHTQLCRRHFESLGMSAVEMAMGWYGNRKTIERHVTFEGLEHLSAAIDAGRGVVLYSAHLTSFEFFFPVLRRYCPRFSGMYKEQRNPLMNEIMNAGRGRSVDHLIPKENVRDMLRELKRNAVVWYASDLKFSGKNSVIIPFFGEPAMTNTAISRIASRTGAIVLTYFCRRLDGPQPRYVATIGAPLPDFPTADPTADVRRLVSVMEEYIRMCPEQYWWIHKRFSHRPAGFPDAYAPGPSAK